MDLPVFNKYKLTVKINIIMLSLYYSFLNINKFETYRKLAFNCMPKLKSE